MNEFQNRALEERDYLAYVRGGDTRTRLNAVRQLRDETDGIMASAMRLCKVFEIVEDDEGLVFAQHVLSYASHAEDRAKKQLHAHKLRLNEELSVCISFPRDRDGNPLAWPDPHQPEWYLDAWNGVYDSLASALAESRDWVANEAERTLAFGEPMKVSDEA